MSSQLITTEVTMFLDELSAALFTVAGDLYVGDWPETADELHDLAHRASRYSVMVEQLRQDLAGYGRVVQIGGE